VAGRPSGGQHPREHIARARGVDSLDGRRGDVEAFVFAQVTRAARTSGDHQMWYGPMPFAGLGFVDDDHVSQFGQRQQLVWGSAGRRRVEHHHRARGPPDLRGGDGRGDGDLQLQQHDVAVGDDSAGVCRSQRQVCVGPRRHDYGVLGSGVDDDHRRAAWAGQRDHAVQADFVVAKVSAQLVGCGVGAERRDKLHGGACAGGGDGLIATLAARRRGQR
jgi:hypothetical protein